MSIISMNRKKILIAIPTALLEQFDIVCKAEFRDRSDGVRQALRAYVATATRRQAALEKIEAADNAYTENENGKEEKVMA
jgi:metal-responsive CopG/Arc/MetJ family transcriptional regulator